MAKARDAAPLLDSETKDLQVVERGVSEFAGVIERLAPTVDVEKLERIIALNERVMRINAVNAFNAAYSLMQSELPEIDEKGKISGKNSEVRSRYAKLEDIQTAVKPILAKHGFALRHRTEWPADKPGIIRIVGILSHEQGHSEESVFEAPMDRSDYRTDIQSMGSTVSYGRRYSTIDLLNIVTRGVDNDGQTAGRPQPPDGYEEWAVGMEKAAVNGLKAFEAAWETSQADFAKFKTFMVNHDKERQKAMKAVAAGKRS